MEVQPCVGFALVMHWMGSGLFGSGINVGPSNNLYRVILSITEIKMLQMDLKQRAPPSLCMTALSPEMGKLQAQDLHLGSS